MVIAESGTDITNFYCYKYQKLFLFNGYREENWKET